MALDIAPHALELIQAAEINQQIATAKRYPRPELAKIKSRMMSFACLDEETAESCFYTLRRQDRDGDSKVIQGPSVRLAEIAVACYGNLRAASRIIDNDGRAITAQGVCHDLENNTLISVEVKRRITGRSGKTYSDDMQIVTGNAANSIAFRNAVFKVIPGALVDPVFEAAKRVAVGDATTLVARREKILKRFNSMGVDVARVLQAVGRETVEAIDLGDLETLIGIGTAIKGGDISIDEAFPQKTAPASGKTGTDALKDKLKAQAGQQPEAKHEPAKDAQGSTTAAPAPETPTPTTEAPAAQQAQAGAQDSQPQAETATDKLTAHSTGDDHLPEAPEVKHAEEGQEPRGKRPEPTGAAIQAVEYETWDVWERAGAKLHPLVRINGGEQSGLFQDVDGNYRLVPEAPKPGPQAVPPAAGQAFSFGAKGKGKTK
jgi:hypothetical protein